MSRYNNGLLNFKHSRNVFVPKPEDDYDKAQMALLMDKTRGVCLHEDLRNKTVYHMDWHPTTKHRVEK